MSAVDTAVRDGVDVVSMSLGSPNDYFSGNAKGTLAAAMAGVFVSMSAGNDGPQKFTVGNGWPWQTTVGASTTDRKFISTLILGNGVIFEGASLHSEGVSAPIVYGGDAARKGVPPSNASFCMNGTLDAAIVKGKIVLCNRGYGERNPKAIAVRAAGGVGFVLRNTEEFPELYLDYYVIPMTHVTMKDGHKILDYIKSTKNPSAEIKGAESIRGWPRNPSMAVFSSQGPNRYQPNLGKPDVTAPGVDILAAMSLSTNIINFQGRIAPVSWLPDSQPQFSSVMSGTSMSCPHVSGIAANIKHLHPDWSQSMIRSAIMTTATVFDNTNNIISDFHGDAADPRAFGAGHVNPRAALNPGLVYDTKNEDYISYICSLAEGLRGTFDCSKVATAPNNFNYPSLTVTIARNSSFKIRASRTLTNVVKLKSPEIYRSQVEIHGRSRINVTITPSELQFTRYMEEQKYDITIAPGVFEEASPDGYTWGQIKWTSHSHTVSIPLQLIANNA